MRVIIEGHFVRAWLLYELVHTPKNLNPSDAILCVIDLFFGSAQNVFCEDWPPKIFK
jgi:hypothetical protein